MDESNHAGDWPLTRDEEERQNELDYQRDMGDTRRRVAEKISTGVTVWQSDQFAVVDNKTWYYIVDKNNKYVQMYHDLPGAIDLAKWHESEMENKHE